MDKVGVSLDVDLLCALPIMSSIDSFEILNPNALMAFRSSRASIDLRSKEFGKWISYKIGSTTTFSCLLIQWILVLTNPYITKSLV